VINSDVVRSAEFLELRRTSAELKATLTEPLSLQHQDSDARAIGSWDEIASVIEELGRKGLQIQRYNVLGEMNAEQLWAPTVDPAKRNLRKVKVEEMESGRRHLHQPDGRSGRAAPRVHRGRRTTIEPAS
jgi:DNA gyrase subunit B